MKNITLILVLIFLTCLCYGQSIFPINGGNVGIGTTDPKTKLDVNGNVMIRGSGTYGYNNPASGELHLGYSLAAPNTAGVVTRLAIQPFGHLSGPWKFDARDTYDLAFLDIHYGLGPGITLNSNGNLGIGVINPNTKLAVGGEIKSFFTSVGQTTETMSTKGFVNLSSNNHGSVLLSSNLYVNANDDLKVANNHGALSGTAILMPGNSMPNQGSIIFYNSIPKAVDENSLYSGSASLIIKDNGNVGIGTISPMEKLSVNGKIRAKEIKVENEQWPDYVFDKTYTLTTLSETEEYITQHKHLPEIPSAKQVTEMGVSLGGMSAKLLKKIEELTLHLIKQEKLINSYSIKFQQQDVQIENLKKQMMTLK